MTKKVTAWTPIWLDRGTGSKMDGTFFKPVSPPHFHVVGHFVRGYHADTPREDPNIWALAERNEIGTYLKHPVDYEKIWDDTKTNARKHASIWRPIPPKGFVALGYAVSPQRDEKPPLTEVVCVHHTCVLPVFRFGATPQWSDRGSGGRYDVSVWRPIIDDAVAFDVGTDFAVGNYNPPHEGSYVLNKDSLTTIQFAPESKAE